MCRLCCSVFIYIYIGSEISVLTRRRMRLTDSSKKTIYSIYEKWVTRATTAVRTRHRCTKRCTRSARLNAKPGHNGLAWRSTSRLGKTTRTNSPIGLRRSITKKGHFSTNYVRRVYFYFQNLIEKKMVKSKHSKLVFDDNIEKCDLKFCPNYVPENTIKLV